MATNTGPSLLPGLLAISQTIAPTRIAAVTFIHPGTGDDDALHIRINDLDAPAWRYPGCYSYTREAITAAGLNGRPIGWHHPRHQWWLMARERSGLPSDAFLAIFAGPTLADGCHASGQPPN